MHCDCHFHAKLGTHRFAVVVTFIHKLTIFLFHSGDAKLRSVFLVYLLYTRHTRTQDFEQISIQKKVIED